LCVQYMQSTKNPQPSRNGWRPSCSVWSGTISRRLRGYRYDLRHFLAWRRTVQDGAFVIQDLAEHDLIAYRQHMVAAGRRPAAINRRLEALRRLCRWARGTGALTSDVAHGVRPVRTVRDRQPVG